MVLLFVYATVLMYLSAGPFAEGLRVIGEGAGVGQFTVIQWLAPLASKAPWIVMAAVIMWQGRGIRFSVPSVLLAFQMAQWTLLLSLLALTPFLAGLAQGAPEVVMLDHRQGMELLLTAAQSLFAVALLSRRCPESFDKPRYPDRDRGRDPDASGLRTGSVKGLAVSRKSAVLLLGLFAMQWTLVVLQPDSSATFVQGLFTAIYVVSAVAVFLADRTRLGVLVGAITPARRAPAPSYPRAFANPIEMDGPQLNKDDLVTSAGVSGSTRESR
jgi:hypothetical protein